MTKREHVISCDFPDTWADIRTRYRRHHLMIRLIASAQRYTVNVRRLERLARILFCSQRYQIGNIYTTWVHTYCATSGESDTKGSPRFFFFPSHQNRNTET